MNKSKVLMLIYQIVKLYQKHAKSVLEKYSISQAEFDILAFLNNNPELNTASDICEIRMLKKSIVSQSIEKLVKKGYIYKLNDTSDKRVLHLFISDSALPIVEDIKKVQEEFFLSIFSNFTKSDMEALYSLVIKLNYNILEIKEH